MTENFLISFDRIHCSCRSDESKSRMVAVVENAIVFGKMVVDLVSQAGTVFADIFSKLIGEVKIMSCLKIFGLAKIDRIEDLGVVPLGSGIVESTEIGDDGVLEDVNLGKEAVPLNA